MKFNHLIAFIFFINSVCSYSQITFQTNYNPPDFISADAGWSLTADTLDLLMNIGTKCEMDGIIFDCQSIMKVNEYGEEKWNKYYIHTYPYNYNISEIKLLPGDGFIVCGEAGSPEMGGWMPCLMKINENGDTIWFRCYDDVDKNFGKHVQVLPNGHFAFQGTGKPSENEIHAFVIRTNDLGEKKWDTIIDFGIPRYRGGDFYVLQSGEMVFGYKWSPLSNQESLSLTKTDSLGKVTWTKILQTNESDNYCNAYMTPLLNGGFVLGYCIDTSSSSIQYGKPPKLFSTDSLGNLKWTYTFTGAKRRTITQLITASNGDIIGSGFRILDDGMYGWLFRLTQEGQLLWKRAYRPDQPVPGNILSQLNDVVETPDGGIAAVGIMLDSFPGGGITPDVWLLKVDADGCLTPGCTDSIVTATVERRGGVLHSGRQVFFRLWPNPVSGEAQLAFYQPAPPGTRLRVFNAQGLPVAQQEVPPGSDSANLDFSGLPPGLYLVQYLRQGRVLQVEKVVKE